MSIRFYSPTKPGYVFLFVSFCLFFFVLLIIFVVVLLLIFLLLLKMGHLGEEMRNMEKCQNHGGNLYNKMVREIMISNRYSRQIGK